MSEIPKAYEPQSVESRWYQFWLDRHCFTADPARASSRRPAYSIVIPPPNVTGVLTLGHVLNNTIQDILARRARMLGFETLWLPGTDHAGIATQTVVERALKKEGLIRHRDDIGREKFLEKVWDWKEKHGGIIIDQLRKLGCSCDWTRARFTMDPEYSRCVQRVFVDLYKKGRIYRGKRMVNWCPSSLTALSDEEVVMKPQNGMLYYFKVEVVEKVGQASSPASPDILTTGVWLTIATTRPETIPGDTAVAVNPKDPRYAQVIGKHVVRPLPAELPRDQKLIPVIGDEQVDFQFGTGVLKVTPAHDKADFEIGQRHQLPVIDVMNPDATMNALAGVDLNGLDRFKARKVAGEKLKELGSLEKEEPYQNNIGYSERADVPIEPRLSEQWFLKYPSADKAQACVEQEGSAELELRADAGDGTRGAGAPRSGKMRFFPQRWAKVYDHWMENIQDWCISRQLWWGHRIPVWTLPLHVPADEVVEQLKEYFQEWGVAEDIFIQVVRAEPNYGDTIRFLTSSEKGDAAAAKLNAFFQQGKFDDSLPKGYPTPRAKILAQTIMSGPAAEQATQDPDVFDTWFSAWLWPFATMGWTDDKTRDSTNSTLQTFYPTTDLVTAPDIIFFWVARMIMAGYEYMGEMPFRNVYFTGIIRDKQGRKMSKSLGNSPDPLDLIGKFGADALRFGIMRSAPLGQDILFDEQHVELGRNFCNKLWNACRFRQMVGQASSLSGSAGFQPAPLEAEIDPSLLTSDDKWVLLKLDKAIREIDASFAGYKFSEVTQTLYRFFWSEYCDWYVEAAKAALGRAIEPLDRGNVEASKHKSVETPSPSPAERSGVGDGRREGAAASTLQPFKDSTNVPLHTNKLAVIDFVLSHTLRLFHPFLPFITEELWHGLGYNADLPADQGGDTIMFARWPKPLDDDFKAHYGLNESDERFVEAKYELVTRARNLRREFNIATNKKVKFVLKVKDPLPAHEADVIKLLLNAESLDVDPNFVPSKGTPSAPTDLGELFLPLEGLVDLQAEKARLEKERAKIEGEIAKVQSKLDNRDFVEKVPPSVLEEHRKRLADGQAKLRQVKSALDALG